MSSKSNRDALTTSNEEDRSGEKQQDKTSKRKKKDGAKKKSNIGTEDENKSGKESGKGDDDAKGETSSKQEKKIKNKKGSPNLKNASDAVAPKAKTDDTTRASKTSGSAPPKNDRTWIKPQASEELTCGDIEAASDTADESKSHVRVYTKEEHSIRKALLERAYHLPGNNYWQDLLQYLTNSNPFFGVFYRDELHPVSRQLRLLTFLGSVIFGLAITNIIYLAFVLDDRDFDASYYEVSVAEGRNITSSSQINQGVAQVTQVDVTSGMIALWTIGGVIHALYDNLIWSIAACACCWEGGRCAGFQKYRKYTPYVVMFFVVGVTAVATLAVLIRATVESNEESEEAANTLQLSYTDNAESYRFLIAFSVELVVSIFFWSPVIALVLFTGCIGCYKVPVLGGRPAEIRAIEEGNQSQPGDELFDIESTT